MTGSEGDGQSWQPVPATAEALRELARLGDVGLVEAVGSDAALAVSNADLSFRTLELATEAPTRLRDGNDINIAVGIISASQNVSVPAAREPLQAAAARAGISEAQAARAILNIRTT